MEELNNEARSLPGSDQLIAAADDEYRQMEADYSAVVASD